MPESSDEVAHIVNPGQKLRDVVAGKGQRVKAICGTYVVRKSTPAANVCGKCFSEYRKLDLQARTEAEEGARRG